MTQTLRPADTVYFVPNEKHWHGADGDHLMTHLAIQPSEGGMDAVWLEPVTDEQYESRGGLGR